MKGLQRYAPAPIDRARIDLYGIPKGYLGTSQTLQHIQALIRQGAKDFFVRQKAIDILLQRAIRPKDYPGEIRALFEWVQKNVRYTRDPFRVEVLHSARRMLELRAGDCDDMTTLLAAMLESIGHPTRLVIIGPDPFQPRLFSHIYLEVHHKGSWIPLDPTMPFAAGWAPKAYVKKVISIDRRNPIMFGEPEMQGIGSAAKTHHWLVTLARAVRGGPLPQRDPRVKQLYELLRQRKLWERSPRMRRVLRFAWRNGLANRPRPITGRWFYRALVRWGLLRGRPVIGASQYLTRGMIRRPFRRVGLTPVAVKQVRPVQVTAGASQPARRRF